MAEMTKDQLKSEIEKLKAQLKEADERKKLAEETMKGEGEFVPKTEFDKLFTAHQNLSQEHDELVLRYEADPELAAKVERAVEKLQDKPKALLFKKMALALGEVKRIPKNGWNDFHRYKYSQEGDILDGIRPILSEVGLMLWTDIVEEIRKPVTYFSKGKEVGQRTITKVKIQYTIGCADTGETISTHYFGEGEDESDKGLYKAYTGATKYFLTKNFLISSGDILKEDEPTDPEFDGQRHQDKRQNPQNGSQQRPKQNQGQSQPQGQKTETDPVIDGIKKSELLALWKTLAGEEKGFEGWYSKNIKAGAGHNRLLDFLNGKIAEKQAEAKQEEKGADNAPNDADAPPEETNEAPPKDEPNNQAEAKNPDEMTPEEYLEFVEESLPFPLTPSEREQLLRDAREGKRNHGHK